MSIQVCDNSPKAVSITYASGFVLIQARSSSPALKQDTDVSIQPVGIYEFVLKPGSIGYVNVAYDFCPNAFGTQPSRTANYSELTNLFQSSTSPNYIIYKLNGNNASRANNGAFELQSNPNDQLLTEVLNVTDVGLRIDASDLTKLNTHAVSARYTISAEPTAERATYVISKFYGICPGELLTIGDTANDNSLQWVKGPFYGCTG